MTYEECVKAWEDDAWLMWQRELVKLYKDFATAEQVVGGYCCVIARKDGYTHVVVLRELRIATPNDMLKYGE